MPYSQTMNDPIVFDRSHLRRQRDRAAPRLAGHDFLLREVADRVMIADDVVKLVLTDSSGAPLPPWRPGAHIDLVLNDSIDSKTAVVRQYSLCGNPYDPFYEIAVLKEVLLDIRTKLPIAATKAHARIAMALGEE